MVNQLWLKTLITTALSLMHHQRDFVATWVMTGSLEPGWNLLTLSPLQPHTCCSKYGHVGCWKYQWTGVISSGCRNQSVVTNAQRLSCGCGNRQPTGLLYAAVRQKQELNLQAWLCELFWVVAIHEMDLKPVYIRSEDNIIADTLSRLSYASVAQKAPSLLSGYNLCCERELFDFCRESPGADVTVSDV